METVAYLEHDAWRRVCEQLRAMGAVTDEDLSAPQSERRTAAGRLFGAIREWGRLEAIRRSFPQNRSPYKNFKSKNSHS